MVDFKLRLERFRAALGVVVPVGDGRDGAGEALAKRRLFPFGNEHFGGSDARERRLEVDVLEASAPEFPATERQPRKAPGLAAPRGRGDRKENRVALLREQRRVGEGSRRHDARNLALEHPLAGRALLLDHHDRFAEAHETRDVLVERHEGDARHRNGVPVGVLAALRERDADQAVGEHGVLEERFVEVPHAEEDERVRVAGLDLEKLPHGRRKAGELIRIVSGHGHGLHSVAVGRRAGRWPLKEKPARGRALQKRRGEITLRPLRPRALPSLRRSWLPERGACPRAGGAGRRSSDCRSRPNPFRAILRRLRGR